MDIGLGTLGTKAIIVSLRVSGRETAQNQLDNVILPTVPTVIEESSKVPIMPWVTAKEALVTDNTELAYSN
ncbi:hypothetical protein ACFX13_027838 [Malus domestica]